MICIDASEHSTCPHRLCDVFLPYAPVTCSVPRLPWQCSSKRRVAHNSRSALRWGDSEGGFHLGAGGTAAPLHANHCTWGRASPRPFHTTGDIPPPWLARRSARRPLCRCGAAPWGPRCYVPPGTALRGPSRPALRQCQRSKRTIKS